MPVTYAKNGKSDIRSSPALFRYPVAQDMEIACVELGYISLGINPQPVHPFRLSHKQVHTETKYKHIPEAVLGARKSHNTTLLLAPE